MYMYLTPVSSSNVDVASHPVTSPLTQASAGIIIAIVIFILASATLLTLAALMRSRRKGRGGITRRPASDLVSRDEHLLTTMLRVEGNPTYSLSATRTSTAFDWSEQLSDTKAMRIGRDSLQLRDVIGEGAFGRVYKGEGFRSN